MKKFLFSIFISFFYLGGVKAQICPATPGTEKIVNGDFESGVTGFTNDFTNCIGACNPLPGDQFVVTTNPNNHNTGYFANMTDHTPGAGNRMLVFDFNNNSTNQAIYRTTVAVENGKTYFFSAWFANIAINNTTPCGTCPGGFYIPNSPILKFNIAGVDMGTVRVDSLTNNWNQYFTTYTATANTNITIEIINLRGGNASNDLALDDISFTDGCEKITNLATLGQASDLPDQVLNCNVAFPYALNPGLPGSYGHTWKSSGGAVLGTGTTYSVPPTPADGTKIFLCYEYIPGCPRTDSVVFRVQPIAVNLGSDVILCAPVNHTINSGISTPPATVQWFRNGTSIAGATGSSYTATQAGTYRVDVSRAGCGSASDEMVISNPVSSFSGSGTYCAAENTSSFSVVGASQVKWYTVASVGTALNPGNTNPSISPAYSATNTTTPGCASGLYAEDVSSYPGTLIPGTTTASTPCPANIVNYNGNSLLLVEVNQTMTLNSVSFVQQTGWGNTGTFTFSIFNNGPNAGPWCGGCTPPGNYDGPTGGAIYTASSGSLTIAAQTVQTIATNHTLAPGRYWFQLSASGGAYGIFDCNRTLAAGSNLWQTPLVDNTGNNVIRAISAIKDGNIQSSGSLFNMNFQVGSNNACSRLFICATENCPAPVEWLDFNVQKIGNNATLVWLTASEKNNSHFIVEKSYDGISFDAIAEVKGAANKSSVSSYSFEDKLNGSETLIYYRIKQVDLDGTSDYSVIRAVSNAVTLDIYPIPVKKGEDLSIKISAGGEGDIYLSIYDPLGKQVFSSPVNSDTFNLELPTTELPSGTYFVKLTGSENKVQKIVVE
ncbi:MAG: T9SS type A sorting domain-containing protein [Cytophagaceae bacterium]